MCKKNKCVYFNEIISLIIIKMKNRSHRYDINRPRPIHRHKHSKLKIVSV